MNRGFVLLSFVFLNLGPASGQPTRTDDDCAHSCSTTILENDVSFASNREHQTQQRDVLGDQLRMFKSDVLDLIQRPRRTDNIQDRKLENIETSVKSIQEKFESHNRQTGSSIRQTSLDMYTKWTQVDRILNSLQSQITNLIASVALINDTCSQSATNVYVSKTEVKLNGGLFGKSGIVLKHNIGSLCYEYNFADQRGFYPGSQDAIYKETFVHGLDNCLMHVVKHVY